MLGFVTIVHVVILFLHYFITHNFNFFYQRFSSKFKIDFPLKVLKNLFLCIIVNISSSIYVNDST